MALPIAAVDRTISAIGDALLRGSTAEARTLCVQGYGELSGASLPGKLAGALARFEARAHLLDGNTDAALDTLVFALAVADGSMDESGAAHALHHSANVHFFRGELDCSERLHEVALIRARAADDGRLVASTTLSLGVVANVRGDLRRARSYYRRALSHWRRLRASAEIAGTLNNLGMLYADLGQWNEAEAAFSEALTIHARGGDRDVLARLHNNLAEVWLGRGDLGRARADCVAAMAVCDGTQHGGPRGEVHKTSGVVARESGALGDADAHFAVAERIAHERQDLLLLAEVAREQGDLYRRQGRNRDTLAALNRSHRLFRQLRAQRDLADVDRRVGRLEGEFLEVARRWGESIEAKDCYTQGHCQRVADLACLIAEHAGPAHGFDAQTMFWYRIGALLHDVGKLDVPAEVLNKPGKLTDDEWAMMRGHAEAGVTLLGDLEFPWDVRPIVLSHHERWDGRGYPHGLAGDAIPLSARVLAVADVYDALTSVRSYKRAMPHEDAMRILHQDAGTAFDPQVVAWFDAVAPTWRATLNAAGDSGRLDEAQLTPNVRAQRRVSGLDEVTGLPGRRAFFDECARVLAARTDDGRPTTLLLLTVVPALGAPVVDEPALVAVAEAISRNTRGGDFVGRYAAREFVVLLPDTNADEGGATLSRLRNVVGAALQRTALGYASTTVASTTVEGAAVEGAAVEGAAVEGAAVEGAASVAVEGAASVAPEHGATVGALLAAADASLRRSRRSVRAMSAPSLQTAA